jgi:ATP-dependent helicase HrpB
MAARRMAETLGERVGETVGYRVRMDTRVSSRTRIEVVTEGILTRMVQHDPVLPDVGLVIFDEFHERTLHADLALALVLHSRALVRDDLRVLVMSATLDAAPVARLLGGDRGAAPIVRSEGRIFPVDTRHVEPRREARVEATVASATLDALARDEGDLLVFLPGAGEIRRVAARLGDAPLAPGTRVVPLYGDLPPAAQDDAVRPSAPGARKVVLATSIAETSLTIEGVRVVIDSGLSRVPRFSPRTGMTRLETVRVSRASADQRRGRAGRVAPGVCYRLWAEHEEHHLLPQRAPEILEADLAPFALELAAAGIDDPSTLAWLDAPPDAALSQARELLAELDAIDGAGRITARGRRMAELPLHPRLAHMLLEGASLRRGALACDLAALLEERDVLDDARDADVRLRLDALRGARSASHVDRIRRVRESAAELRRLLGARDEPRDANLAGLLLAFAYPDRIGQRRGASGRFVLRNGAGAAFAEPQPLSESPFIVAAELDGRRPESRIYLAAPLDERELEAHFGEQIVVEETISWDEDARAVIARRRTRLGAIVLADAIVRDADPARVSAALLDGVRRVGIAALPWSDAARRLRERLAFLHALDPATWPDVSDDALARAADEWLAPHLDGLARLDQLARLDLGALLLDRLPWSERAALDELAPTHVVVPSGSRLPIDYGDPAAPVLAVRLQEMFGLADTPRIARGRVPLTLHLLSPAHRPVQVTRDLAGFWRTTYFDVRKDLRGRYPKHHWPEDPMAAEATSRSKRRMD